jgi:spermidine/putrescine transport system ATP-binding protein
MLERVDLQGFEKKYVHQLSGGQKQRVAIARCLVLEPTVLLLDEPLGALDLKLREHMKLELKKLQSRIGTTFIYITHDQGEAMTMSDQVAVMLRGRMEQIGTPEELYNAPATPFVAAFVGDTNRFIGRVLATIDGYVTIGIGSLKVKGIPQPELGNKSEALCFIRPQNILLRAIDEPIPKNYQTFPGYISEVIFEGHARSYIVDLAEDLQLKVIIPQATRRKSFSVADQVQTAWNPEDTLCFSTDSLADIDMNVGY